MPPKKNKKKTQRGDGLYDKIANTVFGADLKDGEVHAPQWTRKGLKFGSYIGPGTSLQHNLRTGRSPVSRSDTVAQMHDINYTLANNPDDVRAADLRMINTLNRIQREKGDYKFNLYMAKLPIKLKMWAEDRGIIKQGSFSTMDGKSVNPEDLDVLTTTRDRLAQEGYGKKKTPWITHVKAYQKKHGCSYKEAMRRSKATYHKTKTASRGKSGS